MATRRIFHTLLALLASRACRADYIFNPKLADVGATTGAPSSTSIDLSSLFNNRAFGVSPGDADLDGTNSSIPASDLPPSSFIYSGVNFSFPGYRPSGNDNALSLGQTVSVPRGKYQGAYILAASETGIASGSINGTYGDGTTSSTDVLVPAWWNWESPAGGDIVFPKYFTNASTDWNRSMIYLAQALLNPTKELVSVTLPNVTKGAANGPKGSVINTRLHVFSLSLLDVTARGGNGTGEGPLLEVQYAASYSNTNATHFNSSRPSASKRDTNESFR